ncbi:MAG: hypothetical protein AAF763_10390 [Pseudomonadota bacterium]
MSPADESERKRNPVYDLLVGDDPEDLQSLVAYALYKAHKREWAAAHRAKHGENPGAEEEGAFADAVSIDRQIDAYKQGASDRLLAFANSIVEERRPEMEREAVLGRAEEAAARIESGASFWRQVWVALISTLLTTIILVVLTLAAALFGIDVIDGFRMLTQGSEATSAP